MIRLADIAGGHLLQPTVSVVNWVDKISCQNDEDIKPSTVYAEYLVDTVSDVIIDDSRVSTNLTEQISRRFQEGIQETSRTYLRCFGMLHNVPNLLVCLK